MGSKVVVVVLYFVGISTDTQPGIVGRTVLVGWLAAVVTMGDEMSCAALLLGSGNPRQRKRQGRIADPIGGAYAFPAPSQARFDRYFR